MALIEEFERTGNWLFKRRSWIPALLFIPAVLVIWFDKQEWLSFQNIWWSVGCLMVSALGLLIRAWTIGHTPKGTSGRNTKEGQVAEKLNTTGVYSIVRHPLYLGNFLMWFGVVLYTGHTLLLIFAIGFFWIYYERIMFAEEAFIRKKFGEEFKGWASRTPAFAPAFSKFQKPELAFSIKNVLKREYTGFALMMISFSLINFLKHWSYEGSPYLDHLWQILLPLALVIYFVLRSVKKHTEVLNVEGR